MISNKITIIPCLDCQASCSYCFSSNDGHRFPLQKIPFLIDFIANTADKCNSTQVDITFHGGEPLLAPKKFYVDLITGLIKSIPEKRITFSIQTNLWALDEDFINMFKQYNFQVSTSIDGPEDICDANRGTGYWAHTMHGVSLCQKNEIPVSAIATLSTHHTDRVIDIANFFLDYNLNFSIRPIARVLGKEMAKDERIAPQSYLNAYTDLFKWYVSNRKKIRIESLDSFINALIHGVSGNCVFEDCIDLFTVIDPYGDLYHCQRFCGCKEYSWGNIEDCFENIYDQRINSSLHERYQMFKRNTELLCGDCSYTNLCKGGCFYNAETSISSKDPNCLLYKDLFSQIQTRIIEECVLPENTQKIINDPFPKEGIHPLFRRGPCISIVGHTHPSIMATNARLILVIHELAKTSDPSELIKKLSLRNLLIDNDATRTAMNNLRLLISNERNFPEKLYVHITAKCPLKCRHCYNGDGVAGEWTVEDFSDIATQAKNQQVRILNINGGEPLFHAEFMEIMNICRCLKGHGMRISLSSTLSFPVSDELLYHLIDCFDEIKVSIDGDEATHNSLRCSNCYRQTICNLRRLSEIKQSIGARTVITINGVYERRLSGKTITEFEKIASLCRVEKISLRPILPVGNAIEMGLSYANLISDVDESILESDEFPKLSCGLNESINIRVDGNAYPCFGTYNEQFYLGNVFSDNLFNLIHSPKFQSLNQYIVDNLMYCKTCEYRYLCGGICHAWIDRYDLSKTEWEERFCKHIIPRLKKIVEIAENYLVD